MWTFDPSTTCTLRVVWDLYLKSAKDVRREEWFPSQHGATMRKLMTLLMTGC